MTKAGEEYHRKRALGLCGKPGCNDVATDHSTCPKHHALVLLRSRESKARRYEQRKLAGICVRGGTGCDGKAREHSVYCASCYLIMAAAREKWAASERGKAKVSASRIAWKKARRDAGLCQYCTKERDPESPLCPDHQDERRQYDSRRTGREVRKVKDSARAEDFMARMDLNDEHENASDRYWNRGEGSKSYCQPHTHGVSLGAPPFFYAYCTTCQEKKAAGKVTGDEGPLRENWAKKARRAKPKVDWERLRRNQEARRKFMLSQVPRE